MNHPTEVETKEQYKARIQSEGYVLQFTSGPSEGLFLNARANCVTMSIAEAVCANRLPLQDVLEHHASWHSLVIKKVTLTIT